MKAITAIKLATNIRFTSMSEVSRCRDAKSKGGIAMDEKARAATFGLLEQLERDHPDESQEQIPNAIVMPSLPIPS
jgi:hypothetical protein